MNIGDDFFVEFFEVKVETSSLVIGEVRVSYVVVKAAYSSDDTLVYAVGNSNISFELSIRRFTKNS